MKTKLYPLEDLAYLSATDRNTLVSAAYATGEVKFSKPGESAITRAGLEKLKENRYIEPAVFACSDEIAQEYEVV